MTMTSLMRRMILVAFTLASVVLFSLIVYHTVYLDFMKPSNALPRELLLVNKALVSPAYRVCKPGPPLGYPERPSKLKNCLVIGDSVSIGYTPFLRQRLKDVCRVQRSPVDNRYGGARDSRYGLHCLPMFLRTTAGNSTYYDVIFFNFGLHDITYLYDKKFMDISLSEYSSNLASIKRHLGRTGAKLVFITTTPAPHKPRINVDITKYNREAIKVMATQPKVIVYDLYETVVERCRGNTTEHFQKCGIFRSPSNDHHFNDRGSREISGYLAELVKNMLHDASPVAPMSSTRPTAGPTAWVRCPGKGGITVGCPPGSSCCKIKYTESAVGCCHLANPVECGDDNHYCAPGWVCNPKCWLMKCFCHKNVTVSVGSRGVTQKMK